MKRGKGGELLDAKGALVISCMAMDTCNIYTCIIHLMSLSEHMCICNV